MKGSIRRRSKNSWEISLDIGRDSSGKRLRKFVNVKGSKRDADRKLRGILVSLDRGIPLDSKTITVSDFLRRWLADCVSVQTRPRTYERYESDVRLHLEPVIGHLKLSQLSPSDIQTLESDLLLSGKSSSSVRHVHVVLKSALKKTMKWGIVYRNVADLVDAPRVQTTEIDPPDIGLAMRIFDEAFKGPYGPPIAFLAQTGCRRGETLALEWSRVDLEAGIAHITKSLQRIGRQGLKFTDPKSRQSVRRVKLGSRIVEILRERRGLQLLRQVELSEVWEENDLVFPGPIGKPLDPATLTRNFIKIVRKLGLDGVRLHDMRHFHASQMYANGLQLKDLQQRMGHSSVSVTADIYTHVDIGMQKAALEAFEESMSDA
ncbi:MAG: hypothetical protein BZY82_07885 [SAR202 cluster bacterium Io17-Chloro-G3]|nr:MAG: hypothetical protein BZY82_07885 [SAR202 cluster bacterium Io17-Chloro-G3]